MATIDQVRQEILDLYNGERTARFVTEQFSRAWKDFYDTISWRSAEIILPSGTAKIVEEFGGEGEGERRWVVFSVNDSLFRVEGSYTSWDGTDWSYSDLEEVEAVQVTVTEYRTKH